MIIGLVSGYLFWPQIFLTVQNDGYRFIVFFYNLGVITITDLCFVRKSGIVLPGLKIHLLHRYSPIPGR